MTTPGGFSFRRASNLDCAAVQSVVFGALVEYGLRPDPADTDKDLSDLEAFYFETGGDFSVVLDRNHHVVGCFGLLPVGESSCELRKMYLAKSARGAGLGTAMLQSALARAKELGFRRVELETASALVEAVALYKKFGFQPCARTHVVPRCDQAFELYL